MIMIFLLHILCEIMHFIVKFTDDRIGDVCCHSDIKIILKWEIM